MVSGLRAIKKTAPPDNNKKPTHKDAILPAFIELFGFLAMVLLFEDLLAEFGDFANENLVAW